MCVDQSNFWTSSLSWIVFIVFTFVVPMLSHFYLACSDCDNKHSRPYDSLVQLSLSGIATLSFVSLSRFLKVFGLRRFLFFDKLCDESEIVRKGYTAQLNRSLKILSVFVIPCFTAECAYKIWWYSSGATAIPFLVNVLVSNTLACTLELLSWLYRTVVFYLICILFRLLCSLQILRLQEFAQVFQVDCDVESVLREHLRIKRHLKIISHRYRAFILLALIFVTVSQFASLLSTTSSKADPEIFKSGEIAWVFRVPHCRDQRFTVHTPTIDVFETPEADIETPMVGAVRDQVFPCEASSSDYDDVGDEEDEFDNTKLIPAYAYSTISFQKRQALVTYFENNRAGITVFGFMLDRMSLRMIVTVELSLVLWLLGKTIGARIS
nr:hypothetical protein CTI12_AA028110 [Tanacetum cinerariifolium]